MTVSLNRELWEDLPLLHRTLAIALDFPAWYGGNLDALYDCLTDQLRPVELEVPAHLPDTPGVRAFARVLSDAARENPNLTITLI